MQNQVIEDVVESIAQKLGRGLSLEDPDGVLLAYSSHQTSADRVRVNFLLSKKVPADVSEWQLRHGIAQAVRAVAVPANEELGMLGRVCVPLLVRGFRVGYLWVQQQSDDDPASGILAALPAVRPTIDRLAELLLETDTASSERRTQREATFLAACRGVAAAIEDLRGWRELGGGPWRVAVVHELTGVGPDRAAAPEGTARGSLPGSRAGRTASKRTEPLGTGDGHDPHEAALLQRTLALQATVGVAPVLFSAGASTFSVLLCAPDIGRRALQEVLDRYRAEVPKRAGRPAGRVVLGLGESSADHRGLADSFSQAQHTVQAAAVDPQLGDVSSYADIGVYQFLGAVGWQAPAHGSVHFAELSDADRVGELLPVLELLYDKNGSVQDVAAQLHLHRSTVYNRLARIRSVVGADPLGGMVRLELHLALKARRWRSRPRFEQS
ncbi:PucR family transcriptional regulator [Arthrobacter sedimenti]|uniref:PucR family transcriptional regulator n=1 Tax=Arthrobacter sedimenti TaxID=2694931 RepID=UPI000B3631C5|nr:helix-turn-helix domain-containing protein [Arthrobacter sedimenti]OUM45131.1 PucR family transcriptional regulator [Arthrobacter agilis]